MPSASKVANGMVGTVTQYNNLRSDVLDASTGHDHTGLVGHGKYCGGIPIGGIIIWSGAVVDIPTHWHICDGTTGTPDLRNRFVIGAGGSYAVAATGGATTHSFAHTHGPTGVTVANESSHTHGIGTLATDTEPDHSHDVVFSGSGFIRSGSSRESTAEDGSHSHGIGTGSTGAGSAHTHALSGTTASGGSATQDTMPPYYALCYIQRIT